MRFTVPQFIEYEAKVMGPFTFKQFIIVATAGIICFIFFLKTPLYIFLPVWIIVGGGALALTFLKISGRSPLVMLQNFLMFSISSKIYLWKRKRIPPKILKKEVIKKKGGRRAYFKSDKKEQIKRISHQSRNKNKIIWPNSLPNNF